jgi:hypothetical protein
MVREVLEGVVSPTVATALLFEALESSGQAPPGSVEEMRSFAKGPLNEAVRRRIRDSDASEIRERVDVLLARALDVGSLELDVDVDGEDGAATAQMTVVRDPVPVVVLSARPAFAERLVACLGDDRVETIAVSDEAALSKAVFAHSALVVVLDGVAPAPVDGAALAAALRRLPNGATTILWASETEAGAALRAELDRAGAPVVTLGRADGIEPLLDLVLSRRQGD